MSVLLQCIKTEKYVEQADGWTTQAKQAKQFNGAAEGYENPRRVSGRQTEFFHFLKRNAFVWRDG